MVSLASLWLPILLSAVFVFILSSIIHMLLPWHRNDFRPLPEEDVARTALRVPAGDYVLPHAAGMEAMKSPEFTRKMEEGPVAMISVAPPGSRMGRSLALWFVYSLVVALFAAYIASRALGPGADYLDVFRFAGTTAFAGYALALWQSVIWFGRSATTTLKSTLDGLLYALVTAGVLGWLWPAM